MTDLIVCLTGQKPYINHVKKLIEEIDWGRIFLVTDETNKNLLKTEKEITRIVLDFTKPVSEIIKELTDELKHNVSGTEVALNLVSGGGKEHMAILAAILRSGVGFRLVALTKEGIVEL